MGTIFAFFAALFAASENVLIKKSAIDSANISIMWIWQVTGLFVVLPLLVYVGVPNIENSFWYYGLIAVGIHGAALYLYITSLRGSDLSLVTPMLAFSPIVTAITEYFIFGDSPPLLGLVGICFVVLGAYLLGMRMSTHKNLLSPFYAIYQDFGMRIALVVAFLWGISTTMNKGAVENSSGVFFAAFSFVVLAIVFSLIVVIFYRHHVKEMLKVSKLKVIIPVGIINSFTIIFQSIAAGYLLASYVSAIKQSHVLIGSGFAKFVFNEPVLKRLPYISIMFMGVVMIVLSKI